MTHPPAPDYLLDCTTCKCKTGCQSKRCSCQKAGLSCTELCCCIDCRNVDISDDEKSESELAGEISDDDNLEEIEDF